MPLINKNLEAFFSEYERAFSSFDFKRQAELFGDVFISAGPRGAVAQNKPEFLKLAEQAVEFYKRIGQTSAKILSLEETPVSHEYSMVKVHWGVTFQKTGTRLIEFDVSYFIQMTDPEPKIIMFIAHQDEQKAMQEMGLMTG